MSETTENHIVALPAIVDLDALDGLRDRLTDAADLGLVRVDAAGVERIATNGLLLLLGAAGAARRNGFAFEIAGVDGVFKSAVERLGLSGAFAGLIKG